MVVGVVLGRAAWCREVTVVDGAVEESPEALSLVRRPVCEEAAGVGRVRPVEVVPRDGDFAVRPSTGELLERGFGGAKQRRRRPALRVVDRRRSVAVGVGRRVVRIGRAVEAAGGPEVGDELPEAGVLDGMVGAVFEVPATAIPSTARWLARSVAAATR